MFTRPWPLAYEKRAWTPSARRKLDVEANPTLLYFLPSSPIREIRRGRPDTHTRLRE